MARIQCKETNVLLQAIYSRTDLRSSPIGKTDGSAIRPYHLLLTVNRAGASDVLFNRRIAGVSNFSCASNGDFQRLGERPLRPSWRFQQPWFGGRLPLTRSPRSYQQGVHRHFHRAKHVMRRWLQEQTWIR